MLGICFQEAFVSLNGGCVLRASWHVHVRLRLPVFHDSAETLVSVIQ